MPRPGHGTIRWLLARHHTWHLRKCLGALPRSIKRQLTFGALGAQVNAWLLVTPWGYLLSPHPHTACSLTPLLPTPLQCWSWPVANARGQKQASRTHTSCLRTCARLAVALVSQVCLACCLFAQTLPVDTSSPIPSETAVPTANPKIPSRPSCANSWRPACWWTLQSASPQPSCWSCPL